MELVADINKTTDKAIKAALKDLRKQKKVPAEEKAESEMRTRYERINYIYLIVALGNLMDNFKSKINNFGNTRIQPNKTITAVLVNCLYTLGYYNGDIMEDRRPHVLDWEKTRKFLNDDLMTKISV